MNSFNDGSASNTFCRKKSPSKFVDDRVVAIWEREGLYNQSKLEALVYFAFIFIRSNSRANSEKTLVIIGCGIGTRGRDYIEHFRMCFRAIVNNLLNAWLAEKVPIVTFPISIGPKASVPSLLKKSGEHLRVLE